MNNVSYALLLSFLFAINIPGRGHVCGSISDVATTYSNAALSPALVRDQSEVVIRDGWIQEGPPSQTITAAYMVLENHTSADISLKSASTEVAQVIELHKMELIGGMMKMRKVEAIDIAAGGTVELKPGGYHLMVIGLRKELKAGDTIPITLQFSHDIRKTITIPVKRRSAMVKED